MKKYLDIVKRVKEEGEYRGDERTRTGTVSVFRANFTHDLNDGFPLMTHKKVSLRSVAAELLWFLSGRTDLQYLHELDCTIWDEWANEEGQLGPIYGEQWRGDYDQLSGVIEKIMSSPQSRRLLVSSWNPAVAPDENIEPSKNPEQGKQALPPCHYRFQFYVTNEGILHLEAGLRSSDVMLGLPYNIASYALLLEIVALMTGKQVGTLYIDTADTHIYQNHLDSGAVDKALGREDKLYELPTLSLTLEDKFRVTDGDDVSTILNRLKDIDYAKEVLDEICNSLDSYEHHPGIKMKVAI